MIMRWRWPWRRLNLGTSSGQTAMTRLKRATPASAGSCVIASPRRQNSRGARRSCGTVSVGAIVQNARIAAGAGTGTSADRLHRDWSGAFGDGQALFLTLTYRASSALTPEEWLKRAHRDLVSLRAQWRREWGAMPPHLWSREFTTGDTPHFHILIPWEGSEYLKSLRPWLRTCWASITGASRNLRTGYAHLVKVSTKDDVEDAIQYLMKSVAFPRANRPVPLGTPSFRSWGCSQRWDLAQRPTRLANSN